MLFSFSAIIQRATDENEANKQIQETKQILFCENCSKYPRSYYSLNGVFETDEVEKFTKALQENLIQFCEKYKEI